MFGLTAFSRFVAEQSLPGVSLHVRKTRLHCSPIRRTGRREETNEPNFFGLLILVEYHAINHHVVASSDVMNPDWDTDLNSRSYGIFIQRFATPRYISDGLSEVVGTRPGTFSEHDCTARSVLGDRPVAFGRGCCCGSLRDLCPRKRSRNCQGHTE